MNDADSCVLGALGDLVEDIRVRVASPVNIATDTDAHVTRTRGGSAANVAVAAAAIDGRARFIGQLGSDPIGAAMAASLTEAGVETTGHRGGRTGTIVVLVGPDGERTMLTDRGSSNELSEPVAGWLDGLHTLHVPAYSLVVEPLATTTRTLVAWAHERRLTVSIDLSSTAAIASRGLGAFTSVLTGLSPSVVFANEDEAALVGSGLGPIVQAGGTVVVHGPHRATARHGSRTVTIAAERLPTVPDTTGAGDAFAAGCLCARAAGAGLADALSAGHAAARRHLTVATRAPH